MGDSGLRVLPVLRVPAGRSACGVRFNGTAIAYRLERSTDRLTPAAGLKLISGVNQLKITPVARLSPAFNADGAADLLDLLDFVSEWSAQLGTSGPGLGADVNSEVSVDLLDLLEFLGAWLPGCV